MQHGLLAGIIQTHVASIIETRNKTFEKESKITEHVFEWKSRKSDYFFRK